ncbi:Cytochrome P450 86B1 like [Actinidia chinensis var. chinensis]|uniref:Cytochrome P450 86B1 like n=1 Tax=Actinidia chinensis var. chinensis TaxID=1590841 RepID=A0A2R6REW7_ACTCC|nr:Cytochrome P450 86B1 like [Actinidia chinensis var. chinensis]
MEMAVTSLIFSAIKLVQTHLWFSDIAITLLGLFIFTSMIQKITNKGPMLWPVMGIIPSLFLHISNIYDWVTTALIKTNGTFHFRGMWMGRSHGIVTSDPVKIEYMLKTNFMNFPKGMYYRERFYDLLGDGIFNTDGELWKLQRRSAISEMSSYRFLDYSRQSVQDLVHQKLLKVAEKVVNLGSCFDLQDVLLRFTFDNICTTAFGIDPGCLSIDLPEVPFARAFEEATELTLIRFMVPPFVWKPMKFFRLGFEKRLKESVRVVHEFAEKTVRDRRLESSNLGGLKNKSDLLSRLMESEYHFTDKLLKDFCISLILAGRDTSSVGLAWFFWLIHKNPQVKNKILHELNGIIKHRHSKNEELNRIVFTTEELKKMVYLEAALSESLRLYPPVPFDFKDVLENVCFPDGTFVKKGDRVIYSIFSMARIESVWGQDCREFKPERWIENGKFVSENQFKYPVFNAGPRLCVGRKFAYLQMKMVAASILLRYSVKVVEGHKVVPKMTTTLYMKHGLLVTLEPRMSLM